MKFESLLDRNSAFKGLTIEVPTATADYDIDGNIESLYGSIRVYDSSEDYEYGEISPAIEKIDKDPKKLIKAIESVGKKLHKSFSAETEFENDQDDATRTFAYSINN